MILDLRAAVRQLYAALPGDFVATRNALVKEAKAADDKAVGKELAGEIGALRKPTVAAWALNHFVRVSADGFAEFQEFAELMREAQRTLDAEQMRVLGRERTARVDALAEQIEAEAAKAGQQVGAAVGTEIRDTLVAFLADEEAEASVLSGALVKSLSYAGFGSVDIDDAVAAPMPVLRLVQMVEDEDDTVEDESADEADDSKAAGAAVGDEGDDTNAPSEAESATTASESDSRTRKKASSADDTKKAAASARRAAARDRLESALATAEKALSDADRRLEIAEARRTEATEGINDLERRLAAARNRLAKAADEVEEASGIRDDCLTERDAVREAIERHDSA